MEFVDLPSNYCMSSLKYVLSRSSVVGVQCGRISEPRELATLDLKVIASGESTTSDPYFGPIRRIGILRFLVGSNQENLNLRFVVRSHKRHNMSWSQQQNQPPQDLASHFHLLPFVEAAADAVERGAMDQRVNELVNDLASRFERCQQLLNSITISNSPKPMTLRWQKQKLEQHETQLNLRRDLLAKYKGMIEEAVSSGS